MSINPQYTFDNLGNPVGVFIPIEEWNTIAAELHLDIPEWQKQLLDSRLKEYNSAPDKTLDWDDIIKNINKEDEAI
jgi:putative addiction module component (TIGR02574 family)